MRHGPDRPQEAQALGRIGGLCRRRGVLALSVLVLAAMPARAQVIQIGNNGSVSVYSGPGVFTAAGAIVFAPVEMVPAAAAMAVRQQPALPVANIIAEASRRYGIPSHMVEAVAWQESHFEQFAVSRRGAIGIMQLMPGTARQLGVDPHDLRQNVFGGVAYLRSMLDRYGGNTTLALAAYSSGANAVDRYRGVPPFEETRSYVTSVAARSTTAAPSPSTLLLLDQ